MTAVTLRAAHATASDRLLVWLGFALVRLGRARAERRVSAIRRHRMRLDDERRRAAYQLAMITTVGARR